MMTWLPLTLTLLVAAPASRPASRPVSRPALGPADKEIAAIVKKAPGSRKYPRLSVLNVLDRTTKTVHTDGSSVARRVTVRKILKEAGARSLSVLTWRYDPFTSRLKVLRVRVWRKLGGKMVPRVLPVAGAKDLPAPAGIIFWGFRVVSLAVPDLEVGDSVEVVTNKAGYRIAYLQQGRFVPPMKGHFYDIVMFQGYQPILEIAYTLKVPRNKPIRYRIYNGAAESWLKFDGQHNVYTWRKRKVPPLKRSAWHKPTWDVGTKLVVATLANWRIKSRWFYRVNEPMLRTTPRLVAAARAAIKGARSEREKVRRLNHWVADRVRYVGLRLGAHEGYTVHPADLTFEHMGGVCKDKAAILASMMRAVGIRAYVAMTMVGPQVVDEPADQFNHCVTAWKRKDGRFEMLDPTWAPMSRELWASAEQEQHYLIGTARGEPLARTAVVPPEKNRANLRVSLDLKASGDALLKVRMEARGGMGTTLRRIFGRHPEPTGRAWVERFARAFGPNARLTSWRVTAPRDYSTPFRLRFTARVPGYAAVAKDRLALGPAGMAMARDLPFVGWGILKRGWPKKRKGGLRLGNTVALSLHASYTLPAGWRFMPLGKPPERASSPVASAWVKVQAEGRRLVIRRNLEIKRRSFKRSRYPGFRSSIRAFKWKGSAPIVATRAGAPPKPGGAKAGADSTGRARAKGTGRGAGKGKGKGKGARQKDAGPGARVMIEGLLVTVEPNRVMRWKHRVVRTLSTWRAISRHAEPRLGFDAAVQRVKVLTARVQPPGRPMVLTPKYGINELGQRHAARAPFFGDLRLLTVSLLGLQPRCTAEIAREGVDLSPRPFVELILPLTSEEPAGKRTILVKWPRALPLRWACAGCRRLGLPDPKRTARGIYWSKTLIKGVAAAQSHPGSRAHAWMLITEVSSWKQLRDLLRVRFDKAVTLGPALGRKLPSIHRRGSTPLEKLTLLMRAVQERVRTVYLQSPHDPFRMRSTAAVWRSRYGSPREKVALLVALSRAVGLGVRPVLATHPGAGVPAVPLAGPFKLVLLGHSGPQGRELYVDPSRGRVLTPADLEGRAIMALDRSSAPPRVIAPAAGTNRTRIGGKLALDAKGRWSGTLRIALSGRFNPFRRVAGTSDAKAAGRIKSALNRVARSVLPGGRLVRYSLLRLGPKRTVAELTIRGPKPGKKAGRSRSLLLPTLHSAGIGIPKGALPWRKDQPLQWPGTVDHSMELGYELAKGWRIVHLPRTVTLRCGALKATLSSKLDGKVTRIRRTIAVGSPLQPGLSRSCVSRLRAALSSYAARTVWAVRK